MGARSTQDRFGSIPAAIHWLSTLLIIALIVLGFSFGAATSDSAKVGLLKTHIILGVLTLVLTLLRIVWWIFFDRKPAPAAGMSGWMNKAASSVHGLLYLLLLIMAGSGIGMMVLSGAGQILFGGGARPLPNFHDFPPHVAHGLGALILVALLALHVVAALYHHFVLRDGLLDRMRFGAR